MTTIQYSYDFILNSLNNINVLLDDNSLLTKFNEIVKQNRFNPKKYVKKFNYTNWRNAFKKEDEAKKNTDDIIIEKINLLLNKISKNKFEVLSNKIVDLIGDNKSYLNYTINKLFKLATDQHLLTAVYSDLCLFLNEKYEEVNLKEIILNECKSNYKNYNKSIELINLSKTDDENDYDILCRLNKNKKKLIGIFHLIGNLFMKELVDSIVIWKYLDLLFKNLKDNDIDVELREQYISCLKELLTKTGNKLLELEKDKFQVDIINIIKEQMNDKRFNNREKFMFMDIIDLFE